MNIETLIEEYKKDRRVFLPPEKELLSLWLQEVFSQDKNLTQSTLSLEKIFNFCFKERPVDSNMQNIYSKKHEGDSSFDSLEEVFYNKIIKESDFLDIAELNNGPYEKFAFSIHKELIPLLEGFGQKYLSSFYRVVRLLLLFGIKRMKEDPSQLPLLETQLRKLLLEREKSELKKIEVRIPNFLKHGLYEKANQFNVSAPLIACSILNFSLDELTKLSGTSLLVSHPPENLNDFSRMKDWFFSYEQEVLLNFGEKISPFASKYSQKNKRKNRSEESESSSLHIRKAIRVLKDDNEKTLILQAGLNMPKHHFFSCLSLIGLVLLKKDLSQFKEDYRKFVHATQERSFSFVDFFMPDAMLIEYDKYCQEFDIEHKNSLIRYLIHLATNELINKINHGQNK